MNPCRVLVVEDESIVAMDIEDRLVGMGYHLAGWTFSGEEALALAEAQRPDLVLMDIRLQGEMDGITAAERIRNRYQTPVIFLTAYSEDATLDRAKLAEPYGYILKPFDDRELKSAIEIAIHKHGADMEIRRVNRLYDVLSQVNQAVVRIRSREELFPTICRLVVERGNVDLAWIGWLDPLTARISPVCSFGGPSEFLSDAAFYADSRPEGQGNPGKAIREGKPFVCNECVTGACLYPTGFAPARFGFQSCGAFPIRFQGEVCGVLSLCLEEANFFQEREIGLLEEVALDVSFALDKIEGEARREMAEAKIRRQNAVLAGINKVFREALTSHTEEDLGRVCLAVAEEVTGSRFGFLGEIKANGRLDDLAISDPGWEACRMTDPAAHHRVPTGFKIHGIYGRVLKDGKGFFTNEPAAHPDSIGLPPGHPPLKAFLGAPLVRDGRTIGMIGLGNREGGYGQEELEALEAMIPAMVEAFARKRAEEGLRKSETYFSTIFHASPVAIAITRLSDNLLVDVNDAWARLTGFSREEVVGRSAAGLNIWANPDERNHFLGQLESLGTVNDFEALVRHNSGELFDVLMSAEQIELDGTRYMLSMASDITERKRVQEALRSSEARMSSIFHSSPVSIAITRLSNGQIIDVNEAWLTLTGLTREEAIGRSPTELNCWVDSGHRGQLLHQLMDQKTVHDFECRFRHKSGRVSDLLLSAELIELLGERCMLSLAQDVSHRKREEAELRRRLELQDQLAKIAASVPGVVHSFRLRKDGSACMPFTTPAVEDLFGIPQAALAEDISSWAANVHPDDLERVNATVAEMARGPEPWHDVYRYLHPIKGLRWIEGWSMPQVDSDGSILWHGFIMDITERKEVEAQQEQLGAQLRRAQKMEALGTLAGGIAHDFNNILGIIFGYTEIARMDPGDVKHVGESLDQIFKASLRAKDLVQQILAFSRQGEQKLRPVQVGLIVKEALKMLRASLPATIDVKYEVTAISTVLADPTQIHQVLMNLCTNAAHAMQDEGGVLDVRLRDVRLEQESIPLHLELQPGPHVELTIKDTGHGIERKLLDRIFDPFFTTKARGVGTGLGLSVVHGIVKRHGGAIAVESLPGEGTTFQVFFPAIEGGADTPAPKLDSLPGGRERILVVDDEPLLATAMKAMLERLGYRVEYRTEGIDALEAIRHQLDDNPFDLVITDMTMPRLSGTDLARELQQAQPGLPVILCTGFSEKVDAERARTAGCQGFLMKPVALNDLAPLVRKILDGEGGRSG
jgi:two-component system, cell cycle sensor histidine kinase and response regulator CckA